MRLLWTVFKVALACALVIPVSIIVLVTALGIFGALLGLAILTLKIAFVGLIVWGAFRLISSLLGAPRAPSRPSEIRDVPKVDRYEAEALRELDRELGVR